MLPPAPRLPESLASEVKMSEFDLSPQWASQWTEGVAEVPLLLSAHEVAALEELANRRGLTAGQILRHLIRDFLRQEEPAPVR